jgi:hypothetical protein
MKAAHCTQREGRQGSGERGGNTSGDKGLLEQWQPIAHRAFQKPRELFGILKCKTVNLEK